MPRVQSKGKCVYCERIMAKGSMTRHLSSCPSRKKAPVANGEDPIYHLTVEDRYDSTYWLHVELRADADFSVLDDFLRDIWLECCGHMSEFEFPKPKISRRGGSANLPWNLMTSLHDELDEPGAEMEQEIRERVKKKDAFDYIYDFGSSTRLKLKVVGEYQGSLDADVVNLMARNLPPEWLCECGRPAQHICTDCRWSDGSLLCKKCARKHECGEEYLLPVVNSPRMGVCGYTGRD